MSSLPPPEPRGGPDALGLLFVIVLAALALGAGFVALERGWATGVATYSTKENLAEFSPFRSETAIGSRSTYRAAKKHFSRRASAYWFRTLDQARRWIYTLLA